MRRIPVAWLARFFESCEPTRRHVEIFSRTRRDKESRDSPEDLREFWHGLSVDETEAQSRRQAREYPRLGGYIAELRIPDQATGLIRWQRTSPRNPGHFTLWGDPDELFGFVVNVVAVED